MLVVMAPGDDTTKTERVGNGWNENRAFPSNYYTNKSHKYRTFRESNIIWTYPFVIVYFWGGWVGNLESWNGTSTAKSFNFCVSQWHQMLYIQILPFQENTYQDTPPCQFGNYISRYECNPWQMCTLPRVFFPNLIFAKNHNVFFVENTDRTRCSATIFSSTVKLVGGFNPIEKYESKWDHLPQMGVSINNVWIHHPGSW